MHYCFPMSYSGLREQTVTFRLMDGPVTSGFLWFFCCRRRACTLLSVSLRWNLRKNSWNQPCLLGLHETVWRQEGGRVDVLPRGAPDMLTDLCSCRWHSLICRASRCCVQHKAERFDAEIHGEKKEQGSADIVHLYVVHIGCVAAGSLTLIGQSHTQNGWIQTYTLWTLAIQTMMCLKSWRANRNKALVHKERFHILCPVTALN